MFAVCLSRRSSLFGAVFLFVLGGIALGSAADAQPCVVVDDGSGTVQLPPPGCPYLSPTDFHLIVNGLPAGTEIEIGASHQEFFLRSATPGGSLGGEVEIFDSNLVLNMTGTGALAGFNRALVVPIACEVHTGPRVVGATTQTFDNEMVQLEGEIFGDPDFDQLRITAGSSFGLPSPGQTTLTRLPGGDWNVDSFFDITYQIEFVGAPGSVLDGMSGTTTDIVPMGAGEPDPGNPCVVVDNGTGTVDLPPPGCAYLSPDEVHMIIDGLPAGTTINLGPQHAQFFNVVTTPGGSLGGEVETFDSFLQLDVHGTGALAGFNRVLNVPISCETHVGPRTPGAKIQTFDTEMVSLQGDLFGDPDFDVLSVRAGASFGLPSPGHTTLTDLGGGNFNVDSFFDITYEISFQGAPGSVLDGMSGTTTASLRMQAGEEAPSNACVVPDNGTGTVDLPPPGCGYLSPNDVHMIIDGLPPGTEINLGAEHAFFFNVSTFPGGNLGGEVEQFSSILDMHLVGTGALTGFNRNIQMQVQCEVHTGPRVAGDPVQVFPNEMVILQGQLFGDPDFDFLQISAGSGTGPGGTATTGLSGTAMMPPASTGATQLTSLGGGQWAVDSFFDIVYTIDYQGAPGSVLDGLSGSSTGTVRMETGQSGLASAPAGPTNRKDMFIMAANPASPNTSISFVLDEPGKVGLRVFNVTGRLVKTLIESDLSLGRHEIRWDGTDEEGGLARSGTYFYELRLNGERIATRKAVLIR